MAQGKINLKATTKEAVKRRLQYYLYQVEHSKHGVKYVYLQDKYHDKPDILARYNKENDNWFCMFRKNHMGYSGLEMFWNDDEMGQRYSDLDEITDLVWKYIEEFY